MASPALPPLAELLAASHVVSLPLTTRFRGIDTRAAQQALARLALNLSLPGANNAR